MDNYISELDTNLFGFKVAKLNKQSPDYVSIIENFKRSGVKMILSRVDANDLNYVNKLEEHGFLIKDIQLTYSFNLSQKTPNTVTKYPFSIVPYNVSHFNELLEITRDSFNGYGHYFADERLDKNCCAKIYPDWLRRCCTDSTLSDYIFVAEKDNVAIGFLVAKLVTNKDEKVMVGVIGAVSSKHRNLNVFQALNIYSLETARREGMNRVENNVLINNIPVITAYSKLSFQIVRSEITMHYWT